MPLSFTCPNCSAPLDINVSGATTQRCPYCNTSVIIPEELRQIKPQAIASFVSSPSNRVPPAANLSQILESIQEKAIAGDDIEAIKLLRTNFEIGLKEAHDLVEGMQRGEQVDTSNLRYHEPDSLQVTALDPARLQQIIDMIKAGDKLEAIKLFREATDVSLKDAKDAIEAINATIDVPQMDVFSQTTPNIPYPTSQRAVSSLANAKKGGGGCLLTAFIVFIILVTVVPILIGMTSQGGPLAGLWARINPFVAGRVTLAFGKEGTGPGYFTDARFVSVDNNGHIFVGESNGGRVQVFDEQGIYLTQWKATGEETGDIYLSGMAAGRDGAVYTVVGSQLYVYDGMNGNLLGRLDHPDGWGFDDVTVAPDGSIVAAWYKSQEAIVRFNRNGRIDLLLEKPIENVTSDSEMDMRVAVDGTGNIYALAYFNEAVFIYSPDGRYISRFGSEGDEAGQFTSPRSIAVDNLGRIYISDFSGVMIYASDGRYLDTLPVNGAVMGLAFDDQNNLYLVVNSQVLRYKLK